MYFNGLLCIWLLLNNSQLTASKTANKSEQNSQVTASARAKQPARPIYIIDTAKERKSTCDKRPCEAHRGAACTIFPLD
jgi:hypothetical protein